MSKSQSPKGRVGRPPRAEEAASVQISLRFTPAEYELVHRTLVGDHQVTVALRDALLAVAGRADSYDPKPRKSRKRKELAP